MKKKLLTGLLFWGLLVCFTSCVSNDDVYVKPEYATLKEALEDTGLFFMIQENPDEEAMDMKKRGELDYKEQYSMFFVQDLNHDDVGGEEFYQKVCILFRGFDRPTILVTEGYDWWGFKDGRDLGINLNANVVHVEHRNYGESYNDDYEQWHYQTIAQASADLHAVYLALKPLFPGKWLSTGTSKSAEGSVGYAYFYPLDMDLTTAFCGPFVLGLNDKRFGDYFLNEVGIEEDRELTKTCIRKGLLDGEEGIYQIVCELLKTKGERVPTFTEYVFNLFDTYYQMYQYISLNDGRTEYLQALLDDDYLMAKEVIAILLENRDEAYRSYWVECAKEMGWQNNGYDYFADLLEDTSFNYDDVLPQLLNEEDRYLVKTYDGSVYTDIMNSFVMTTSRPLLLFYVHDDPWSAGMPKQVGPNVKVVVNPIGKHAPYLNDPDLCPEVTKQEVMNFVQTYIY